MTCPQCKSDHTKTLLKFDGVTMYECLKCRWTWSEGQRPSTRWVLWDVHGIWPY